MKKRKSYREAARIVATYHGLIAGSVISCLILFVYTRFFFHPHGSGTLLKGIVFFVGMVLGTYLLKVVFTRLTLRKSYVNRIAIRMALRAKKEWAEIIEALHQKTAAEEKFLREHYDFVSVRATPLPFVFEVQLTDAPDPSMMPHFAVNGIATPLTDLRGTKAFCHVGKTLFATASGALLFSVGDNTYTLNNPYALAVEEKPDEIFLVWQCKGHTNERQIFVAASFLENPTENVTYEFTLMVNGKNVGSFEGYVAKQALIRIPLGKGVSESDCLGKQCVLRYAAGKSIRKFNLPEPTTLSVNGVPVPALN